MADSEKRTVVEGVEFAQLFRFPQILRAVTMAFQPPRLVLGLLMVVALMTVGRIWDGLAPPGVAPAGLLAGPATAGELEAAQVVLRQAVETHVEPADRPEGALEVDEVLRLMEQGYRVRRGELQAEADEATDAAREAALGRLEEADGRYFETLEMIDAHRPRGRFEATVGHVAASFNRLTRGLVLLELADFFGGVNDLFVRTPVAMWRQDKIFTVVYGLFFVVLIALGGGALARMTATDVARGEKLP